MFQGENNFTTFYALSIAWQLGFLIAVPIAAFLFLGFWSDKHFGTKPLFLIVGLLTGLSITVYEVYHMLIPLVGDSESPGHKSHGRFRKHM